MTQMFINNFLEGCAYKLPAIIKPSNEIENAREVYHDYALLVFNLDNPVPMNELVDQLEQVPGITMMYHHFRSRDTEFGNSFSFFMEPGMGEMFKLNFSCNAQGKVEEIDATIFTSLEIMVEDLRAELKHMIKNSYGEFAYKLAEDELISYFL